MLQEPEPESSSSEEEDSTEAEEAEEEEDEENGVVAHNVEPKNEDSQNSSGVTTVQDMTEEQQISPKAHQKMNAANKVQLRGPDAAAVAKTAVRQRAELSQRVGKAVAVLCRLCVDILEAGRATAGLYGPTPGQYGARRQGSTIPQEPAEAERVARRGREFDARLARGLYQVPVPCPTV